LPTREEIEARAYDIYLRRRGEGGDPFSDWLQAEQELAGELDDLLPADAESSSSSALSPEHGTKRSAELQKN
jgi:hypothetical protein